MLTIHHFAFLLFNNYLPIQVGTLQRIHRQYNRYESALDDTLIGIESFKFWIFNSLYFRPKGFSQVLGGSSR